jgi:hypothetical protein
VAQTDVNMECDTKRDEDENEKEKENDENFKHVLDTIELACPFWQHDKSIELLIITNFVVCVT